MSKTPKPVFIQWCASDALNGMLQLEPLEELAYRRIIDLIYVSNNSLEDNDRQLSYLTKTFKKWPSIKSRLIKLNKISIENGYIWNEKCSESLQKVDGFILQKSDAGKASAKAKALKLQQTGATDVDIPLRKNVNERSNGEVNETSTNLNLNLKDSKKKNTTKKNYDLEFDQFWVAYPKKVGKLAAIKAYQKAAKIGTSEAILYGAQCYAEAEDDPKYTKHPATWLNDGGWMDYERVNGKANSKIFDERTTWLGLYIKHGCKDWHGSGPVPSETEITEYQSRMEV